MAVLCTLGALSVIIEDWNRGNWKYCDWIWPAVFAVAFWLGGRGARYILSNE